MLRKCVGHRNIKRGGRQRGGVLGLPGYNGIRIAGFGNPGLHKQSGHDPQRLFSCFCFHIQSDQLFSQHFFKFSLILF